MALLFGNLFGEVVGVTVFLIILIYKWFQSKFSYWSRKGVHGPKPVIPFGNLRDVVYRNKQFFEPYTENYFKYKQLPYVGMYSFHTPVLCINDLDLAKQIMIKDFNHFEAHGIFSGGVGDPLAGHLFNIHGKKWKDLRSKLSPVFSTGKLKTIYPMIQVVAEECLKFVDLHNTRAESVNFSELYAKYALDVIGSTGFGVECNSFKDPQSEFRMMGNAYFEPNSRYWGVVRALAFFAPDLFKQIRIRRISADIINFFNNLVNYTVEYRRENDYYRNDFLQTLIQLKNSVAEQDKESQFNFTMNDLTANAMLYMFAGYETTATTGCFAAYELAKNIHIQDKAREEITKVLANHGGKFTYEAQNEMVYLNMILEETLRQHPPLRCMFRRCTKDYKIPDTDLVIEEGTLTMLPIQSYQMDPDIWPEPEKFDPERFLSAKKSKMHPCQWMPFGEGPRMCLGMRQGYVQAKIALIHILSKYELTLDERTKSPVVLKATSLPSAMEGDVWIKIRPIETNKSSN